MLNSKIHKVTGNFFWGVNCQSPPQNPFGGSPPPPPVIWGSYDDQKTRYNKGAKLFTIYCLKGQILQKKKPIFD